jgi:hypothetical protein
VGEEAQTCQADQDASMDTTTALDQIRASLHRAHTAQLEAARARRAVDEAVLVAALGTEDRDATARLLSALYWQVPEVDTGVLRTAFGVGPAIHQVVGDGPEMGRCIDCEVVVRASSRTHLASVRRPRRDGEAEPLRCVGCARTAKEEERAAREREWRRGIEEAELRRRAEELDAREEELRRRDPDAWWDEPWHDGRRPAVPVISPSGWDDRPF